MQTFHTPTDREHFERLAEVLLDLVQANYAVSQKLSSKMVCVSCLPPLSGDGKPFLNFFAADVGPQVYGSAELNALFSQMLSLPGVEAAGYVAQAWQPVKFRSLSSLSAPYDESQAPVLLLLMRSRGELAAAKCDVHLDGFRAVIERKPLTYRSLRLPN